MSKQPVELRRDKSIVTLKIGRWPFRKVIQWDVTRGEDARDIQVFSNKLMEATRKGLAYKPKPQKK